MSKYLRAFGRLKEQCAQDYVLLGDTLLVEEIPNAAVTKDIQTHDGKKVSLILESGGNKKLDGLEMNKPVFVRVLAKGEGYFDAETGTDVTLDVEPGDVVLVGRMSVNWFSVFGTLVSTSEAQLGLTRESEIKMRFKSQAAYDRCFAALSAAME